MRWGAMNFPVKAVADEVRVLAELGFDYVELAMDPPEAHFSILRSQSAAIVGALRQSRMGLVCHMPTFVYTADLTRSIRSASRLEMLHSLAAAAELGADKVVLHPSAFSGMGRWVPDVSRHHAMESLALIGAEADRMGLPLCLENMFPGYGAFYRPEEFADVFSRFPQLKLTLDIGHAHLGGKGSRRALAFIRQWADRIGHVHLSDNRGRHDDHLPVGQGKIDFKSVLHALKTSGYDDTATLEVFSDHRGQLAHSRQRIASMWQKT